MKLIIFDLDQTLVDFLSVHDEVTRRVFKKFFKVDAGLTEIDFTGKSLTENFSELARLKDIPEDVFRQKNNQLLESYETTFGESLPRDAAKYILPGVRELLNELSKTDHIVALYTGDSSKIVNQVFRATGLGRYFKFCFYGTEVETRSDMVKLAINKAEKSTGREFRDKNIAIIGDSIRDIECGKLFGALTIAVATGFHSEEELLKAEPDYLFDNLKDYRKVLKAID
jgi:phosphoglycolate phosphatase-like HAD superfamily hydrolase